MPTWLVKHSGGFAAVTSTLLHPFGRQSAHKSGVSVPLDSAPWKLLWSFIVLEQTDPSCGTTPERIADFLERIKRETSPDIDALFDQREGLSADREYWTSREHSTASDALVRAQQLASIEAKSDAIDARLRHLRGDGTPDPYAEPRDVARPMPRQRAQEQAILAALTTLGFDSEALPPPAAGRASPAKQAVLRMLRYSPAVMNKTWQRLRDDGRIKDGTKPSACDPGPKTMAQVGVRPKVVRPTVTRME